MSEYWVHIDKAVELVLSEGWLFPEDIVNYLKAKRKDKKFMNKLKKLLEENGFLLREIPSNPSTRGEI